MRALLFLTLGLSLLVLRLGAAATYDGSAITTASTRDGKTGLATIDGLTVPAGGGGIAFVTSNSVQDTDGNSTASFTVTLGATATNGYAKISIATWTSGTSRTVSACTFDGSATTAIDTDSHGSTTNGALRGIALGNKGAGTYTISVTMSGNCTELTVGCEVFSGVHQTTSTRTPAHNTGSSTAPTVNATVTVGDMVVSMVDFSDGTFTKDASESLGFDRHDAADVTDCAGTYETAAGTTVTMSGTLSISQGWGIIAVGLVPAS